MPANRTHPSSPDPTDTPRPTAFFLAVLFAAGVSTWHWYRPLPKPAGQMADGTPFAAQSDPSPSEAFPKPKSKWQDAGLIFPSDQPENILAESSLGPHPTDSTEPNTASPLVGSKDLALEPFHESKLPLSDAMAQTPLPMVPVIKNPTKTTPTPSQARLWNAVNSSPPAESSSTPEGSSDSASPFRTPRVSGNRTSPENVLSLKTEIWPDQGFDPQGIRPLAKETHQIANSPTRATPSSDPGLLSLSSNRIRTLDDEPVRNPPESGKRDTTASPVSPSRRGSLIRQPPPKDESHDPTPQAPNG